MGLHLRQFLSVTMKNSMLLNRTTPIIQSVRFRKPRWVPIAKSKEFYVRKPTPIDPEEHEELKIRYSEYRAEVESLRMFLKQQMSAKAVNLTEKQESDDAADLALMEEQVKEWNQLVAVQRNARQTEEERLEKERIQMLMQQRAEERLKRAIEAEKAVERNKAVAEDFITPDKLDEEINKMLDSRSDYNYAVTKFGEILPGEYPDRAGSTGQVDKKKSNNAL